MQSVSLARAKIQAPRFRSGLIPRSELEARLDQALTERRLVLLVAPAGYGKTAALSRQLQRLPPGCVSAWLTADEDDDLQRFLSHLIEALEPLDPPWRLAPEALFDLVAHGRLRESAAALLRTLEATEAPQGGVIVIDDLHAVADTRVFEFLNLMLEDLPLQWTLAIATRLEPPLSLGRWRARREVAEFDETFLEFSRNEVQALCRHATESDDPALVEHLLTRTGGWAAGLCLGLEAHDRFAAAATRGAWHNRRHLFDYLASEVLEDLPEDLQEFLMRCSVLSELTVPRCRELSGNPRAEALLEDIERRRLFVSILDSDDLTMRLHDLFREFLEERLRRIHPLEVPALLRRAALVEGDLVRRTLMYLRAGAWDEAERSLGDATPDMLASDEGSQVLRIVEQFPRAMQAASPVLAHARGLCAWPHDQYGAVASLMQRAADGFDLLQRHDEAQRARAMQALATFFCGRLDEARQLGRIVREQAMDLETETLTELLDYWLEGYLGPIDGPGRRLARVVDLLHQGRSTELWSRCMPHINLFISRPGVSVQFQRLIDGARSAAGDGRWSLQASANLTEAWLLLWQGRAAELDVAFQRIEEDSRWLGQPAGLRMRLANQQLNHQLIRDDRQAVRASRDELIEHARLLDPSSDLPMAYLAVALRASVAIADWQAVRMHLPAFEVEVARGNLSMQLFLQFFKAALALEDRRIGEALAMLHELVANPALLNWTYLDALVRTRLALAELADRSPAAAWLALEPLLERVGNTGNVGELLTTGVQALRDLSAAAWNGDASPERLADLRRWIDARRPAGSPMQAVQPHPALDGTPLSARELEVLSLLTEGQSNKLIARALDLSPHTVKRHVARILDRLDLDSRAQAAHWYHTHFAA
ncbi:hypothetical protein A8M77_31470 [Variovorax sp. JS1663]|nr:hypothetical protein A8M77_31470 [Variovorax sp. JS1663]